MDLNDYQPYRCSSKECRDKRIANKKVIIADTQFYDSNPPKECPVCGEEDSLKKLQRICLVKNVKKGPMKASPYTRETTGATYFEFYCGRSNDEYDVKDHIPTHTQEPPTATCPECLSNYKKDIQLLNNFLRAKD